jgi:tripartite-type tricarboxylate transporter receptor subunit TctC
MKPIKSAGFVAAASLALSTLAGTAHAAFPEQPIKLVVPFASGGATDLGARIVATAMNKTLPQQLVVDNRPGAGGRIGAGVVATAKPDGYTLLVSGPSSFIAQAALPPALPYDPQKQFTPVGIYTLFPLMLVGAPNLPAKDFKEVVALFRANPGKYSYGSAGVGTSSHYGPYTIFKMLGADLIHVPYKGTGPAITDLQGGRIALILDAVSAVTPRVKSGELKGLVILDKNRVPTLPDVPSAAETFPEILKYDWNTWFGMMAPAGTPPEAIDTLHKAMITAMSDAELIKRYADLSMNTTKMSLPEVRSFVNRQFELWVPLIKAMDLKLD